MINPRCITSTWLARECDPGAFSRGSHYFCDHRASLRRVQSSASGNTFLIGECQGSQFVPYKQRVDTLNGGGDPELSGFRTCPVGLQLQACRGAGADLTGAGRS